MKLVSHPHLPKKANFQLSPEFAATTNKALVDSTNAWLREFFGETECAYVVGSTVYVSPHVYAALKGVI